MTTKNRKERYYTLKYPLKADKSKQLEVSLITKGTAEEDKVIRDIVKGLSTLFYTPEKECDFLVEAERKLWESVDGDVENLKTCIVGDEEK